MIIKLNLETTYLVDKIVVWHYAGDSRTYHNTKTQVSADGNTWTTVFDSAVSGEYPESALGHTITFTPQNVRYVRDYVNGSTSNTGNHWVEIQVWGKATTIYIGGLAEWSGSNHTLTKYYGGIAIRHGQGSGTAGLTFMLGDHLGSTWGEIDPNTGAQLTGQRYKAWGESSPNSASGALSTDVQYTGQRSESSIGLYFYNARFYDPLLGRFISPDSIIPGAGNPLAFDRYQYVLGNPINLSDPSGHMSGPPTHQNCGPDGIWCEDTGIHLHRLFIFSPMFAAAHAYTVAKNFSGDDATAESAFKIGEALFKIYWDLYNTPGWWNNGIVGNFTPIDFLVTALISEFEGMTYDSVYQTAVRNFYYICSVCNPNSFYDVIAYLAIKKFGNGNEDGSLKDISLTGMQARENQKDSFPSKDVLKERFNHASDYGYTSGCGDGNVPCDWANMSIANKKNLARYQKAQHNSPIFGNTPSLDISVFYYVSSSSDPYAFFIVTFRQNECIKEGKC